jgi:hypothetical protein
MLNSLYAIRKHRENQQKDKEWERDIESYKRCLDCIKICKNLEATSLTVHKHSTYWEERKDALEKKWPQLKKIF